MMQYNQEKFIFSSNTLKSHKYGYNSSVLLMCNKILPILKTVHFLNRQFIENIFVATTIFKQHFYYIEINSFECSIGP